MKILSSKALILWIKMLNTEQKWHTLIGKAPNMNIFDCHYVCEHRMKFGGHGSNCIESIEEWSKKKQPKMSINCYTMLCSLSTFHLVSKRTKFNVGGGHHSNNIVRSTKVMCQAKNAKMDYQWPSGESTLIDKVPTLATDDGH